MNEIEKKETEATLNLAIMTDFLNKIESLKADFGKMDIRITAIMDVKLTSIIESQQKTNTHFERLNGSVAEHSKWIDRNYNRIEVDFPELVKKVGDDGKKIYAYGVTMTVVNVLIGAIIAIAGFIYKLIKG